MTGSPRLLGVVLCGGRSSRMGRDKSSLRCADGATFLQHATRRFAQVCDLVAVSCRDPVATEHLLIRDPVADRGPAIGMAASLRFARQNTFEACLFTPVDLPNLSSDELRKIRLVWQQSRGLTVARTDQLQPLVGVYPVNLLEQIERLAASDDRSLMHWLKSQNYETIELANAACHNVNTPEDWSDGTRIRV